MHGGGQKNLFSLPYDFCATLACRMRTLISFLSLKYLRIRLGLNCFWEEEENSNDGKFKRVDLLDETALSALVGGSGCGGGGGGKGGGGGGGGVDNCKLTGKCGPNENDDDKK